MLISPFRWTPFNPARNFNSTQQLKLHSIEDWRLSITRYGLKQWPLRFTDRNGSGGMTPGTSSQWTT